MFDRDRRRQICLYPLAGREPDYNEDDEPAGRRAASTTCRCASIPAATASRARTRSRCGCWPRPRPCASGSTTACASRRSCRRRPDELAFFRVRGQDSVMVSLGPLAGFIGEVSLTVRYVGYHRPAAVEQELQGNLVPSGDDGFDREVVIDEVLTYSNRTAWYPQASADDYARARLRFDVPDDWSALTGGVRMAGRREGGRHLQEYRQDLPAQVHHRRGRPLPGGRTCGRGRPHAGGVRRWSGRAARPSARSRRPARSSVSSSPSSARIPTRRCAWRWWKAARPGDTARPAW